MAETIPVVRRPIRAAQLTMLCFMAYGFSYIGRLNYSAALTELIGLGLVTKTQGGMISTVYFAAYGAGQLINGILADRREPIRQITIGLAGSALLNLAFRYSTAHYWLMLVLWMTNGYFQSTIWPPMFLLLSRHLDQRFRTRSMLVVNTSTAAGTIMAYGFSGAVLWRCSWQQLFTGAAVLLGLCALVWHFGCRRTFSDAEQGESPRPVQARTAVGGRGFIRALVMTGAVLLIVPAMIHGMLKDGVTSWMPVYMTERFALSPESAVTMTILLPVVNTVGVVMAYALLRYIPNETSVITLLFLGGAGSILILQLAGGSTGPVLSALLLALVTAEMMAVNVILCCEVPIRFVSLGCSATLSGFFNACGYVGAACSMYVIALLSQHWGWTVTQWFWTGSCVLAAALTGLAVPKMAAFVRKTS